MEGQRRKGKVDSAKGKVAVFSMFGQLVVCKEKSNGISMADSGQGREGVHSERHVGSSVGRPSSTNQASQEESSEHLVGAKGKGTNAELWKGVGGKGMCVELWTVVGSGRQVTSVVLVKVKSKGSFRARDKMLAPAERSRVRSPRQLSALVERSRVLF